MCIEKMYSNLKLQIRRSIPKPVSEHTKEHLNFYNFSARTTILKAKISLEIKKMISKTSISSKLQQKRSEIFSYS